MAYVTSNNLKQHLKLENNICLLINDNPITPDDDLYFCGECRTMFSVKHTSGMVLACPNCGFKPNDTIYINTAIDGAYHIDDIIDSITLNKNLNDDGSVKDMNVTILYRSYKIACDTKKQISWQHYNRILFNFETKQIYYTNKLVLSKNVEFKHFLLHKELVADKSEFSFIIPLVIKEIYDTYGIVCQNNTWYNSTPKNMQSPTLAFMCLKFPIMMNFAYDLWTSYKRRIKTYCTVDMHIAMIYWTCNYDRVLKKALTSTTEKEYIERTDEIIRKMTNDTNIINSARNNPLYVVYAQYMYHLGFRDFNSVERVVNYVSQPNAHNRDMSVWVFDMLRKRMHIRNKMYRRLLKTNSEDKLLDDLFDSNIKCKYTEFFSWFPYLPNINKFYDNLEQQINTGFLNNNIGNIFNM